MTLLGWGFDSYGIGALGSSPSAEGISLFAAVASSTHEVRVYLTAEPQHRSAVAPGDALNPTTWTVQRLDTAAYLPVMSVTYYAPTVYGIVVAEALGPATAVHEVSSVTLLDQSGGILIPPRKAQFPGLVADATATTQATLASRNATVRDLANAPTPVSTPEITGGTLRVESSGDYATVTGADLVKKLIIRRLTTSRGGFKHLPDYGLDLREKEPIQPSNLAQLKTSVEQQILREPEVSEVSARISLSSGNLLTIAVKASLKITGETLQFSLPGITL